MDNSPAKRADIKEGDRVLEVDGREIRYWYQIGEAIQEAKEPIEIKLLRGDKTIKVNLATKPTTSRNEFNETIKKKIIGIAPKVDFNGEIKFSLLEA